jgi:hypothetical protein
VRGREGERKKEGGKGEGETERGREGERERGREGERERGLGVEGWRVGCTKCVGECTKLGR